MTQPENLHVSSPQTGLVSSKSIRTRRSCYNPLMAAKLLLAPWIIGLVYSSIPLFWFAIHPFARRWRKMRRSPYRVLLPFWMVIIALLGLLTWPWHSARLYANGWTLIPAGAAMLIALGTYRRIRQEFGVSNFIGQTELRPHEHQQAVIANGLHARMRHPIYFAHLCMFFGWTLAGGLAVNYVLLALSAAVTFPLMIWLEERELEGRLGQMYRSYKQSVPLFPVFRMEDTQNNAIRRG